MPKLKPMPTREDILNKAAGALARAGIETARLDARLLMQHALAITHADLISDPHAAISNAEANRFYELFERRKAREPVSRIIGEREFRGLAFALGPATLDPRPDTETLVEEALRHAPASILDLGTGSGAIIVSLLHALPAARGVATDISPEALAVARANAARHGVAARLALICSDWFSAVSGRFDMIISNPPYIPEGEIAGLEPEVQAHDPHLALSGGADGLSCYRALIAGAPSFLRPGGRLILEIGQGQERPVSGLLEEAGFAGIEERRDLAGVIRVLAAHFPE